MSNPNYDDVFTTTIESRARNLRDNITKNIAILFRMEEVIIFFLYLVVNTKCAFKSETDLAVRINRLLMTSTP